MTRGAGRVADSTGNWVDGVAPAWARPYLRLARLDRPIGLTEHIGKAQLPGYFAFLLGKLKPGGRLFTCCSRKSTACPVVTPGIGTA